MQSMTAFARKQASGEWGSAIWELRTVNHRYLDIYFKIPDNFRELELSWREILAKSLSRGKIECFLRFQMTAKTDSHVIINTPLVKALLQGSNEIAQITGQATQLRPYDILRWPGVVEIPEVDLNEVHAVITHLLNDAVTSIVEIRKREGKGLKTIIEQRLQAILQQIKKARSFQNQVVVNNKAKLIKRFEELKLHLDGNRLEQELVLLVQKVDIAEELDRLDTHVKEVFRLLQQHEVIGRRLDFLMQELNREANTLGAKSVEPEITSVAVELKVLIEQIREQVQNIE